MYAILNNAHNKWTVRIGLSLLLFIHGFAHWQLTTGWGAGNSATSWLLSGGVMEPELVARLGTALWTATLIHFVVAALLLLFAVSVWRLPALGGALLSLIVIALFWQPAMIFGAVVSLAILLALVWLHWPQWTWLGA